VDQFVVDNPTPEEYRNRTSTIFCNDWYVSFFYFFFLYFLKIELFQLVIDFFFPHSETRSDCDFHFSYHKCKSCGSYNTSVLNVTIHENSKK